MALLEVNGLKCYVAVLKDLHLVHYYGTYWLKTQTFLCNRVGLQNQGKLAMSWHRDNFLLANTEKFQCLTINPRNIDSDKQTEALQIEDQITTNTLQIKLLGVEIDDKLNFTNHIRNVCIKASQKVGVLLRLQNLIPCIAKLIIYKSSILPHLTYCHLVWHNCRSERIQECTLRAVYNSHSELYENILVCTDLHSLLNRRLQDIAILMYKVKYGLALIIVDELFK